MAENFCRTGGLLSDAAGTASNLIFLAIALSQKNTPVSAKANTGVFLLRLFGGPR